MKITNYELRNYEFGEGFHLIEFRFHQNSFSIGE